MKGTPPPSAAACAGARSSGRLRGAVLLTLLLHAAAAAALDEVKFRVQVAAAVRSTGLLDSNLDIVRWSTRADVSEDQLRQLFKTAPRQVRDLLATEGTSRRTVESALDAISRCGSRSSTVWPGEATRVASIDLQITGAIDQDPQRQQRLRQAREAFGIQRGSVFRQAEWERAKQDTVHSLHHQRYAAARIVDSRADVDPDAHTARLSVHIDSGPPFRFGTVTVTGLERYPPSIVTNLNPIRPGSPYDENELLKFQRRLLASGYFASAVVAAAVIRARPTLRRSGSPSWRARRAARIGSQATAPIAACARSRSTPTRTPSTAPCAFPARSRWIKSARTPSAGL